MTPSVDQLVHAASGAANRGQWSEAERLWHEVRKIEPGHPKALSSLGIHALQRGDLAAALDMLTAAHTAAPKDLHALQSLAVVQRELGNTAAEMDAIQSALAIDPYFLPGLLAKANLLERAGEARSAAGVYRNALKVAPPESRWPDPLRPALAHARAVVSQYTTDLHGHLKARLDGLVNDLPPEEGARWREAVSIIAGRTKPYLSDSNQLTVPRLPAIPFFERSLFPELQAIEAKTDTIRRELERLLAADRDSFTPYIAYQPGDPVNQWAELNHSPRWGAYHLWSAGAPVAGNLDRCPETQRALSSLPLVDIQGLCPNAMFSALDPHTHIPPHHGETNARLVAHLPLIVPESCRLRVGFEERSWTVGEIVVFDDTIEHEARNDSDELRVVLIFDIWNPLLGLAERNLVRAMAAAMREFHA